MPFVQLNDIILYYETYGNGPPLMLVAGLASDSQSWQPILPELANNYTVIVPDNRGVGRTEPQDIGLSMELMAGDCLALAQHLGLDKINLLGHSMGGQIAMEMAIRYPQSVDKLVLAATCSKNPERNNLLFNDWAVSLENGMDSRPWFRELFYWIFSRKFFENEIAVETAVEFAINYPWPQEAAGFRNQVEAIKSFDCTNKLSGIRSKTLVVSGEYDILIPPEISKAMAGEIPDAAFSIINDAAHSIHMEQGERFIDCVLRFLLTE